MFESVLGAAESVCVPTVSAAVHVLTANTHVQLVTQVQMCLQTLLTTLLSAACTGCHLAAARHKLKVIQDSRRTPTVSAVQILTLSKAGSECVSGGTMLVCMLCLCASCACVCVAIWRTHNRSTSRNQQTCVNMFVCAHMCAYCMQVPLLPPSPKIVAAEQQHLSKRVVVTPNDLPSCCFFTLVNTRHGGVTALTTSPDTKHLAGKGDCESRTTVDSLCTLFHPPSLLIRTFCFARHHQNQYLAAIF